MFAKNKTWLVACARCGREIALGPAFMETMTTFPARELKDAAIICDDCAGEKPKGKRQKGLLKPVIEFPLTRVRASKVQTGVEN